MKNEKSSKIITLFISIVMSISLFSGCSSNLNKTSGSSDVSKKSSQSVNNKKVDSNEITDQMGRRIKLPKTIKRVVITSILPIPSIFCIIDGSADKIVGMAPASMGAAKNSMLAAMYPNITKASTTFMKDGNANLEEIAKLKPDIIFCLAENGEVKTLEKTGIPVVAFKSSTAEGGNSLETLYGWIDIIGKILKKTDRAQYLKKAGYQMLGEVQSKLWTMPDNKKPSALVLFTDNGKVIQVAGRNVFSQFWITTAGGKNAAQELNGVKQTTMEQIYKWDPDYIFVTNFTSTQPSDLYNNKIKGQDWSKLKAIKNKKVYKIPLGTYRWFVASSDSPLMIKWMAQTLHPEIFNYYSMNEETRNYYKEFLDIKLSNDQLNKIFNPSSSAADGFK